MNIKISNQSISIECPTQNFLNFIKSELIYKDKSKEYQLKKLLKNPWRRNSADIKKLQSEINGSLYEYSKDTVSFSSAFYDTYKHIFNDYNVVDLRKETGSVIALPWVNKPHDLRDYQKDALEAMASNYRGLINFATGLGKTLLATHFIKQYKKKSLVVCPSESVARQFFEILEKSFGKNKVALYGAGKKKLNDITVGIAASVSLNIEEFAALDLGLVIIDEAHHTPANTFMSIATKLSHVGKIFGLTATDYRSDGKDLMIKAGCGEVISQKDVRWGIENGWLAEPYFIIREVPTKGRDFKDDKLKSYKEHVLNNDLMKSRIESDARSMMSANKKVLILVDEVAHGKELSNKLGIPFATGEDKKSQSYIDALNNNKIPGLVGTSGKIGEGTDTKNVDVLILADFTASKGPVIQAVGRSLRKQGSKTKALILDYIPLGSSMLSRHAKNRKKYYEEITHKIKLIRHEL